MGDGLGGIQGLAAADTDDKVAVCLPQQGTVAVHFRQAAFPLQFLYVVACAGFQKTPGQDFGEALCGKSVG